MTPYGYKFAADGMTLIKDKAEQKVIAWIRESRKAGLTISQIAEILAERGITSRPFKKRSR